VTTTPLGDPIHWVALLGAIVVLLLIDLVFVRGRGGVLSIRTAAIWSAVWVGLSFAFGGVLLLWGTPEQTTAYFAGYLVEKSLSLDNVFVFLVVFGAFAIPLPQRARLLTYGIIVALGLRAALIFVGVVVLESASWVAFPFAALLVWTGLRLWRHRHDHGGEEQLVAGVKARLEIAPGDHGGRLLVREGERRVLTTAGAALLAIGVVDVVFAVDSIPAILAITTDTYVVFAANAFALLGLRPLFFLVADLVERLRHLKAALAILLVFIGGKMVWGEVFGKVGPAVSLAGVALILGAGVLLSLRGGAPEPGGPGPGRDPVTDPVPDAPG
jgi:tellurite resistance protein TerC